MLGGNAKWAACVRMTLAKEGERERKREKKRERERERVKEESV
jgi:hypothetical protein